MKKQLNIHGVMNELKGGAHFFTASEEAQHPASDVTTNEESSSVDLSPAVDSSVGQPVDRLTDQSTSQPSKQQTAQSVSKSTAQPADMPATLRVDPTIDRSPILGRPKAFYITEQQDRDLDVAVSKLSEHTADKVGQKIDRSTVLRLLLEGANLTSDQTIERLTSQLVSRLIRQLTG